MRTYLAAAAIAALALAPAAHAQSAAQQPPAAGAESGGGATVRSLNVIDLAELPQEARQAVADAAAKANAADLKKLRSSLDESQEIKKALADRGVTSADVIVASLDAQGRLTLITKKAG